MNLVENNLYKYELAFGKSEKLMVLGILKKSNNNIHKFYLDNIIVPYQPPIINKRLFDITKNQMFLFPYHLKHLYKVNKIEYNFYILSTVF